MAHFTEELCESFGNTLNIAVYSSNETCVVSGDKMAVEQLQEKLSYENVLFL
jgi:malonyl CoA-acyl carrier protein transacylase